VTINERSADASDILNKVMRQQDLSVQDADYKSSASYACQKS